MTSHYEQMKALGASDAMIAAVDILGDAGFLDERRLKLVLTCERQGEDPERFARHLVKLCRVVEEEMAKPARGDT